MHGHVIVCGLGQVGYQVTCLLLDLGEQVSVITSRAREEWTRETRERGVAVHFADARDPNALEKVHIESAKVLVACTSSDTVNIEIALDAKRLRPDMRVIVRVFDRNLADRLRSSFGIETISTAAVAGSAFALAGLGEHALSEFEIEGETMMVVRIGGPEHDPQFPVLLAVGAQGSIDLKPLPPFDAADTLYILAPCASLRRIHKLEEAEEEFESLPRLLLRALNPFLLPRLFSSIWTNTSPELRAVFVLVNLVILLSMSVFAIGMNLAPVDALYFVITTVTTVGYGDISPLHSPLIVKLFACGLMLLGSASIAIAYSIVTDYIVSQRLLQLGGRRRIPTHDHVVVVGLGDVGLRAAEELAASGARVVVIDSDASNPYIDMAKRHFPTMVGDARDVAFLRQAHVDRARAIIGTTSEDASNLSIGLASKALNPHIRCVVRILDSEFARKVTERTPMDAAISATSVSAPVFVGAALVENALTSFLVGRTLVVVRAGGVGRNTHNVRLKSERTVMVSCETR